MAIPWKIVLSSYLDGFNAFIVMFRQVRVPGSLSEELNRLTTPETLAEYRAVNPAFTDAILRLREDELARDRGYARWIRVLGCIELTAMIMAVCYLSLHYRF